MQDTPLSRLWRYARPYRGRIAAAVLWSFLNRAADIAPPFLIGMAVDVVVRQEDSFLNRTVVVIAHRLSPIRHTERIYVISAGSIVESGTHGELVDHPGICHSLWSVETRSAVNH